MNNVERGLLFKAMELEGLYFQDMTLEESPQILGVLDKWGERENPTVEHASFHVLQPDGETFGEYYEPDKSISLVLEELTEGTICHEMIHHYEHELNELDKSLAQYLTVKLWQKLASVIPDLESRVLKHLEVTEHRKIEIDGGRHDVLFLLKSYDIDIRLGTPLGTTFGYGYTS
jgi:hypothetical protein